MNPKEEIITKIINIDLIKSKCKSLSKVLPVGLISLSSMVPMVSLSSDDGNAYAQMLQQLQQQESSNQMIDPLYESLEIAKSKVQAASSPGASGHGVPGLQNIATTDLLAISGITAASSILTFMVVRMLTRKTKSRALKKDFSIRNF